MFSSFPLARSFAVAYALHRKVNASHADLMRDLDKALADILAIRNQIAAGTAFRGYGPATMALTGTLAFAVTLLQHLLLDDPSKDPVLFFGSWIAAAAFSVVIIGAEARARSYRHHSGLADAMIFQAIEQFLPAGAAGALLGVVLWHTAPETLWLLPGLWQLLVSLGIFASLRTLPRIVMLVGAWYFIAGFATVMIGSQDHALSVWTMGLPFIIGQLLMAAVLHFASGDDDGEI